MGFLELVAFILILAWLGGLVFHIAGGFIHILLVIAFVMLIARFFRATV